MKIICLGVFFIVVNFVLANEKDSVQQNTLSENINSIRYNLPNMKTKDTILFKMPKYIQGKFCDFEDKIQKKKIPLDFSLGKSKY